MHVNVMHQRVSFSRNHWMTRWYTNAMRQKIPSNNPANASVASDGEEAEPESLAT